MIRTTIPFLSLIALSLGACSLSCTEGSGPVTTETRTPGNFDKLELNIPAEVILRKGPASVKISAEANILAVIKTELSGGELEIGSRGCFSTHQTVRIELSAPDLSAIEVNGSGTVEMKDTFQVNTFKAEVNGSGSIAACLIAANVKSDVRGSGVVTLSGSANEQEAEVAGSGEIKAMNMPCNKADADIRGSGNIYLFTLQKIKAEIAGSGSVHYRGTAEVSSDISGSGTVMSDN